MPGPASNEKEIDRGCPEEEDVAQAVAVEREQIGGAEREAQKQA